MPKAKPMSAVVKAYMDLMSAYSELRIAAIQTDGVRKEAAEALAAKIEAATNVLQRTINRAARLLEQGVTDDED